MSDLFLALHGLTLLWLSGLTWVVLRRSRVPEKPALSPQEARTVVQAIIARRLAQKATGTGVEARLKARVGRF